MTWFTQSVERQWYGRPHWLWTLWPLMPLFKGISYLRRGWQQKRAYKAPLPVIIVGNITVGGTGKTPIILALSQHFMDLGWSPIIISRGYGSKNHHPRQVDPQGNALDFGDEPLMLASQLHCPVVVGRDRVAAVKWALQHLKGNLILCDDGLQHYRLTRDLELVVMDAQRRLGNGWCLPLGPLREGPKRLQQVDAVFINGPLFKADWLPTEKTYAFDLQPLYWQNIVSKKRIPLTDLDLNNAHAIAGIGHPQRFLNTLTGLGFSGPLKIFHDHHAYTPDDLAEFKSQTLLMTEKDAIKIAPFADDNAWFLKVEANLPNALIEPWSKKLNFVPLKNSSGF
jgi:tetraacyldisaccharide 4'-kinase